MIGMGVGQYDEDNEDCEVWDRMLGILVDGCC